MSSTARSEYPPGNDPQKCRENRASVSGAAGGPKRSAIGPRDRQGRAENLKPVLRSRHAHRVRVFAWYGTRQNILAVLHGEIYLMRRAYGTAAPIATVSTAPAVPIAAVAHRAPTSAANVPASMLPRVTTTSLM